MGSSPTLADISCGYQTTYHAYQQSVNGFYGVLGNITTPSGSFLQGNGNNDQYYSHLVVYLNMKYD